MKYKNFNFLKNTYWCVPDRSIIALIYDSSDVRITNNVQVVWHITDVINDEYIIGKCYSKFGDYNISNINAMINKEGTITMMFLDQYKKNIFSTGNLFNIKQIKPPFQYENKYLRLGLNNVFQMQLNLPIYIDDETQQSNTYILHNAYMVQATEKTCIWYNLPTTNNSIPEFIAAAEQEEKMRVN